MKKETINIKEILSKFDDINRKDFNERDVSYELERFIPKDKSKIVDDVLNYELIAFDFCENSYDLKNYFRPLWQDAISRYPNADIIQVEMINYWKNRANEAQNPILKARYSGLVYEFEHKVTGTKSDISIKKFYFESLCKIIDEDYCKNIFTDIVPNKLERLLDITLKLNSEEKIKSVKKTIIEFVKRHTKKEDKKETRLYTWLLDLYEKNKKLLITEDEKRYVIKKLEEMLKNLSKNNCFYGNIKEIAIRLAKYYKKNNQKKDVIRVLFEIEKSLNNYTDGAILDSINLQEMYEIFNRFEMQEEANNCLKKIRQLEPYKKNEMITIHFQCDVSKKELEEDLNIMTKGDNIEEIFNGIVCNYFHLKKDNQEEMEERYSNRIVNILGIQQRITDESGRMVKEIETIENALEENGVYYMAQTFSCESTWIRRAIELLLKDNKLDKNSVIDYIKKCSAINKNNMIIIDKSLDAYFTNDYLVFLHLVIPQIEDVIRNILEMSGGVVEKPKDNSNQLRTFDIILKDKNLINILGEDFVFYFRTLFTHPCGWNLRNKICHGFMPYNEFNTTVADRVLHALLCFGLVSEKK